MQQNYQIVATGATYSATTTSANRQLPTNSIGQYTREVRVSATAPVYVKFGDSTTTAVPGDILIQPGDDEVLYVGSDRYLAFRSLTGTATIQVSATEGAGFTTFLDLNFLSDTLDPRITFTRASSGTHFDSTGRLVTDGTDVARFDYDSATLLPRGLLIEEARTNLLSYSQDFTNAQWGRVGCSNGSLVESPAGLVNGQLMVEDATTGVHETSRVSFTVTTSIEYTATVFIKASGRNFARLIYADGTLASRISADIDLSAGTISAAILQGGATSSSAPTIRSVGNGWYRCSVTGNLGAFTSATVYIRAASALGTVSYTGTNALSAIAIYGAQVELGAFPTSYIATTTAAATRAADSAVMTGTNFSSWYNQTQGTFVVESSSQAGQAALVIHVDDGTVANRLYASVGGGLRSLNVEVASVSQCAFTPAGAITGGVPNKFAFAFAANDFAGTTNGGTVATDTSGTLPTVNAMILGSSRSGSAASFIDGHIRSIRYYSTRLPNQTLQALTS